MQRKKIIIVTLAVLALAGMFFAWRHAQVSGKKMAPAGKTVPVRGRAEAKHPDRGPAIAIVIDDFGYNMNNVDSIFRIGEPVTLSILPGLPYSRRIAELAARHGYETILHLPLESHRADVREEFDTIKTGMADADVIAKLKKDIGSVPGIAGVSNHMGSKATEDAALMTVILGYLKKSGLYFLDSLTSGKTVCKTVCNRIGLRCAVRDVFLDNSSDGEYIKKQLGQAKRIALKRGRAVALCHDRKNTVAVLAEVMPEMKREGVRFVRLSELVK